MGAGHGCYNLMAWSLERIKIFNREESRCGGEAAVENQLWLCVRGGRKGIELLQVLTNYTCIIGTQIKGLNIISIPETIHLLP